MLTALLESLPEGAAYFLSAFAFYLVWSTRREGLFHLAQGGIVVLACGVFNRSLNAGVPLGIAAASAVLAGAAVGVVLEVVVYQRLRRVDASAETFLLASFGLFLVLSRLGAVWLGTRPLSLPSHLEIEPRVTAFGAAFSPADLVALAAGVLCGFGSALTLRGRTGQRIAALRQSALLYDWRVGDSRRMAALLGLVSGAVAAGAAVLFHLQHRVVVERVGMAFLVPGFLAVVVAEGLARLAQQHGRRHHRATGERARMVVLLAFGGVGLALVEEAVARWLDPRWVSGTVAVLAVVVFALGSRAMRVPVER